MKKNLLFIAFLLAAIWILHPIRSYSQNYTINTFNNTWCTSSYPTAYVTGSWSITETSTTGQNGFSKINGTSKTIIIDIPAGFEFKTAATAATVTATGTELSSISFVFTSTTKITATLTTSASNTELNTLNFNNFEIRATAVGTGTIVRNGGDYKIDNSSSLPSSTEPFGTLTAQTPFSYTSTEVTQAQNGVNIPQYSINKEILMIKIDGTGSCGASLTQFNLNTSGTDGTDLASNITTAKIYYTGSSSTFATTTLFGSTASPNGAFSVTGTQNLSNGDNYFWLTYDVPGDANTDAITPLNRLDAQLESFVLDGSTITSSFTTPNPAGSRPVVGASFYYSREDGTWNNNTSRWATTDGGGACSCQPNGSGVAVIKHAITLDVNRVVDVVEIRDAASLLNNGTDKNISVNGVFNTAGTGYFNLRSSPLSIAGNLVLNGTGASVNSQMIDIAGNLEVNGSTSLDGTGAGGGDGEAIYVGGSLKVDGNLTHSGGRDIIMDGGVFSLNGTGTIGSARTFIVRNGNKSIPLGTSLTITPPFSIEGAYTITNNGTITLQGNLDANNASAQWTNAASSALNYGGANKPFNTNGIFESIANTNTVNYNRAGNQTIGRPNNSGQYSHLTFSGSGTKTLDQNIRVSGDFTTGTTFAHNNREIYFNGISAQTISGTTAPTFYNFTVANSSATGISFSYSCSVSNVLTFSDGELILNGNTLTVTNSATAAITGGSSASYAVSEGESSILKWDIGTATGMHEFPFGISGVYIPFKLDITAGSPDAGNYSLSSWFTAANATLPSAVSGGLCYVSTEDDVTDRFWVITLAGYTANPTADVYFYYNEAELDGTAEADLIVQRWDAAAAGACKWEYYDESHPTWSIANVSNITRDATNNYVKVAGIADFSPWAMSKKSAPLPIELLRFDAELKNAVVDLTWLTATEINNDFFTIEKTKDGKEFTDVAKVKGAGNSSSVREYESKDENPHKGISYYRLKQTDTDGRFTYSGLVAIDNTERKEVVFTVFPNPSDGKNINVGFNGNQNNEEVLVVLNDIDGRQVYSKVILTDDNGSFLFAVDTENRLPSGIYLVVGSSKNEIYSRKLIIK